MESKYDRVDVPEDLYLHSDEREDFGTGVYPISVISRKSNIKNDTFKFACFQMRRKNKLPFIIGAVFVVIILIVIIAVAANHKDEATQVKPTFFTKKDDKSKGLLFEPKIDGIPSIHYKIAEMKTYYKYIQQLDYFMYDYQPIHQQSHDYVDCVNGSAPDGKACRLTHADFGPQCTHTNVYGYQEGRPCILLRLKLDDDTVIEPFSKGDAAVKTLINDGRWEADHVAVTCDGETDKDREHMGHEDFWYEDGVNETSISHHPRSGFPVWFYPKKNSNYRVPAIMVQFNSIRVHHAVVIKCVAWAKSFNNGRPQDSDVYSVRFQIYME